MQIRLTVLGPLSGHATCACDVLVTAPAGTALAAVTSGLAAAVAAAGSDLGGGTVVVHAGSERLDPQRCALGEPPLIDGAVLALGAPAGPEHPPVAGAADARLHVVSGPDAGGVHLLHGGEVRIGRSSTADIPLDDPDVSRLHCAVTVADDGAVTLCDLGSTNGTRLDGEDVGTAPVPLVPGALVHVGESTLTLGGTGAGSAPPVLPAAPDGEGHLRVPLPGAGAHPAGSTAAHAGYAHLPAAGAARVPGPRDGEARAGRTGVPGPRPDDDTRTPPSGVPRGGAYEPDARAARTPSWAVPEQGPAAPAGRPVRHTGSIGAAGPDAPPPGPGGVGRTAGFAHLAGPAPDGDAAPAPEPAEGRRRGRGIGAWARRLAGGRGAGQRPEPRRDGESAPVEDGAPQGTPCAAAVLRERWPDPAAVLLTALGPGPRLWERGPGHPDLLTVRLGTADRYAADGGGPLPSVPVTADLRRAGALGLAGPQERLSGLARSVLAQLAALHAPGALELVLISADRARPAEERVAQWSWLGWLPHVRPVHGQDCRLLLAYDREQAEARVAELVRRLDDGPLGTGWATAPAEAVAAAAERHRGPYTVVVVDGDPGSAGLRESVARLAACGPAVGIHLLCLAQAPAATPSSPVTATLATAGAVSPAFDRCGTVALLSGEVATVVQVIDRTGAEPGAGTTVVAGVAAVSAAWAERFARALAPLRVAENSGDPAHASRVAVALPRSARLLDELGLARATPASLTARWAAAADRATRPGGRAVAVLGAGPHGPLCVDVAADGPHLVVEGGPGSGKTELLRSLAASLAAGDRPDRLSLVLVDGAAAERGEGLRVCTDLPHVSTYLAAADPVRMREFAQALGSELKRRAELLGTLDFAGWHERNPAPDPGVGAPRRPADTAGEDLETASSGTLKLRTQRGGPVRTAQTALPRLVVLVDDYDALVAPALGSTGRPAAGSVVRALEAVARDGERLGIHLIAASGRPERTADTAAVERAGLRVTLEIAPPAADAPGGAAAGPDGVAAGEPAPGRGRLQRPDDDATTPFQAGRVTGRIPRTATLRPTVVALDWERMGDPPTRRPVRELGNGPTDLALLASALQRAAQSAGAEAAPALL
ncbi:FtsK/SpoIIIE domain-containing protein [Streptomyces sp. NPDC049555]|uniref:FtsK/SpoIIIE domain-containing protein n=1 Tax=Streptomyces sp. NPDC049555 TaxID=3154930 RepID=UPI00341946CB